MYEAFYGLNEKPFNLTPDPRFLYLSSKHKEAFAHLLYGIRNRCGFVMVSGEIGTGKTTICRSLLKQLDPDTEVAFIFNPKLSPIELLQTINADFGIASKAETIRGLIDEMNAHLLDRAGKGKNCVLIIDEAQNLGTETLEQIRLLSNLETETEKLLQIVLIGQPELAEKLELAELRQLNQRITARYHLGTLNGEETLHYIAFRLRVAGGRKKVKFARSAVRTVHLISGGTPRVINALCDRALLIGYTKETRNISPAIVRKAAVEIQGAGRRRRAPAGLRRALSVSAIAAAALLAAGLLLWGPLQSADWTRLWERFGPASEIVAQGPAVDTPREDPKIPAPANNPPATPAENTTPAPAALRGIAEAASLLSPSAPAPSPVSPVLTETKTETEGAAAPSEPAVSPSKPVASPESVGPKAHGGLAELVRAWKLALLQAPPMDVTWTTIAKFATANRLRPLGMSPNAAQIAAIDLPVLVRMRSEGAPQWAALLTLDSDVARLVHGDGRSEEMTPETFRVAYSGDAFYLWNDPTPLAEPLRAMARGDAVLALQTDLKALGLIDREPTGAYDAATVDAISRIQRATGIAVDGIAGPQTRMVLSSWLDRFRAPSLSSAGFTDALRARILANPGMVRPEPAQEVESIPLPELPPAEGAPAVPEGEKAVP
jgi:general secretion pathway protein A